MKRVVVTGLGIVSPVGNNLDENWKNICAGKSGISRLTAFEPPADCVTIAGEVKNFNPAEYVSEKDVKRQQKFVHFAAAASKMALEHAKLTITPENHFDIGVSIGVGIGGLAYLEEQTIIARTKGFRRVSPFTIPGYIANMAAGFVSIETGAKGPNLCTSTACTSSAHAIGEAMLLIQTGRASAMICGGTEAALSHISFAGFGQIKALCSQFADSPELSSRPFDKDRCGFVMGEGSGILILEEYESAKARGANILCELVGYGVSGDGYHFTSPSPQGEGAARAMKQALHTGNLKPEDIDYINAHGTSTEVGDVTETQGIKTVFGSHSYNLNISSTKSMTGHLLGAAGGIEAIYTIMTIVTGTIPPTINLNEPDPECDLNYTPNTCVKKNVRAAISNSFGFGGTNGCLAFKAFSH